jgi:ABC-2 type transport system ATP-binding protein
MAAIELHGLSKRFGHVHAVDDLSFAVAPGAVTGFLGPNGAGKTTTLRMLLGLVEPTAGTATIHGRRYREIADPLRAVGAVLEASSFHPGRTARDHLRVQALAGGAGPRRIEEVLELVGLDDAADRRIGGFSLGMRQRLGLATALLCEPEALILDEPANGLDPEGVRWLRDLLRRLADEGRTVLVSSHLLAEVAQTVDSVIILDRGRLVTHSTLERLMAGASGTIRIRTPGALELRDALASHGIASRVDPPDRVEVDATRPEEVGAIAAEHAIPIVEMHTATVDLEHTFLQLTGARR